MHPLPLSEIVRFCGLNALDVAGPIVRGISTDSRTIETGELFVALRGDSFDGHDHLADAAARGAVSALVRQDFPDLETRPDLPLLRVSDPLGAYQLIAAGYRATLPMRVLGITGSNGKTSTKEFCAAVLARRFRTLKTEGNLNNHIGVPRMLLRGELADEIAVLEMGMNHFGEIRPLADMAKPVAAIITNIGTAHIEHLGSREGIAREKSELSSAVPPDGCVFLHAGDDFTDFIEARTRAQVVDVGIGCGEIRATDVGLHAGSMHFAVETPVGDAEAVIHALGEHMVVNALFAIAAGLHFGLSLDECVAGLAEARLVGGRLQPRLAGGLNFLDDSYNANPDSMIAALATLGHVPVRGRRIAALGRMGELGDTAEVGHRRVGASAAEAADVLLATGSTARWMAEAAQHAGLGEVHCFEEPGAVAGWLRTHATPDDVILVKGSRSMRMEEIFARLDRP